MSGIVMSDEILAWRRQAIASTRKALQAAAEYERVKPGVMMHIKQNPGIYGTEDFALRRALEANWTLGDLTRTVNFHRDLANMLWTAIASEQSFSEVN